MTEVEALVRIAEALESIEFSVGMITGILFIGFFVGFFRD